MAEDPRSVALLEELLNLSRNRRRDTSAVADFSTAQALLSQIDGHVDGLETLSTAGNATLTAIDGHVDGLEGAIGTTADGAVDTDASGTLNAHLRGIVKLFVNFLTRIPAALGAGGGLKVDGSGTALPVSGTVTALSALVPFAFDYISLAYTGSNLTTVVYKTGGSGGSTVATLTLAYSGSTLTSVTRS